jgi:hypothetical protein
MHNELMRKGARVICPFGLNQTAIQDSLHVKDGKFTVMINPEEIAKASIQ